LSGPRARSALQRPGAGGAPPPSHRRDAGAANRRAAEDRLGRVVGPAIHLIELGEPGTRQVRGAHPLIARAGAQLDETCPRERLHDPAQVSGVETEAGSQVPEIGASRPDLEEHARLAKRAIAAEELVVERASALRDEAVEAPDLGDVLGLHCLTLVRQ